MEKITNIQEYQKLIDEVRETKIPIEVVIDFELSEEDAPKLNMDGVDVIVGKKYDTIKPI